MKLVPGPKKRLGTAVVDGSLVHSGGKGHLQTIVMLSVALISANDVAVFRNISLQRG